MLRGEGHVGEHVMLGLVHQPPEFLEPGPRSKTPPSPRRPREKAFFGSRLSRRHVVQVDIQNVGDHNLDNVAFAARRLVLAGDLRGEAKIGLGTFTCSEAGAVLAPAVFNDPGGALDSLVGSLAWRSEPQVGAWEWRGMGATINPNRIRVTAAHIACVYLFHAGMMQAPLFQTDQSGGGGSDARGD